MNKPLLALLAAGLVSAAAMAQFTGPSASRQVITVSEVEGTRRGARVTLEGNIVERQREDYFTFRDATGDIRVEIQRNVWQGREVGPETKVRITGDADRDRRGRYVFVEALDIIQPPAN